MYLYEAGREGGVRVGCSAAAVPLLCADGTAVRHQWSITSDCMIGRSNVPVW